MNYRHFWINSAESIYFVNVYSTMTSRERILQKLRTAKHDKANTLLPELADKDVFRDMQKPDKPEILPHKFQKSLPNEQRFHHPGIKKSPSALAEQFAKRLIALSGEFYIAANETEAAEKLLAILPISANGKCLVQNNQFVANILSENPALSKRCDILERETSGVDFAEYAAGISIADLLIARTGSIVLRNTTAGGRRLSVLPPLHIVLARQSQLVPSLDHALQEIQNDGEDWSYAAIITGPSRTADIQKNIVLGAHGPKRLAVVLGEDVV